MDGEAGRRTKSGPTRGRPPGRNTVNYSGELPLAQGSSGNMPVESSGHHRRGVGRGGIHQAHSVLAVPSYPDGDQDVDRDSGGRGD